MGRSLLFSTNTTNAHTAFSPRTLSFISNKICSIMMGLNLYNPPSLTGGPRSEIRDIERKCLVEELVDTYQLDDKVTKAVIKVILRLVESPMAKGYLCKFLFSNDHKRWREFIAVFHGYTHLAVPLLKAILRCNSASDIVSYWDGLLEIIQDRIGCRTQLVTGNMSQNVQDAITNLD